jgi:hypothetical protein
MTLSAADATAHSVENRLVPKSFDGHPILITLFLLGLLAAVFRRGFPEAITLAVGLVGVYLGVNLVVLASWTLQLLCARCSMYGDEGSLVNAADRIRALPAAQSDAGHRLVGNSSAPHR